MRPVKRIPCIQDCQTGDEDMRKMATKSATIFAFCCASCGTFFRNGKLTFKKDARPHESLILLRKTRRVEVCIYQIGVLGRFKEPPGLGRMPRPGGYDGAMDVPT